MDFVGLDIGTSSIKAVQLKREPRKLPELLLYAKADTPQFSLASEAEVDMKSLSAAFRKFFDTYPFTTRQVAVALPESSIFTRVISLPKMSEKELKNAMKWEAEQYVPVPLAEVSMDYQILGPDTAPGEKGETMSVLLVAAPKTMVQKYMTLLKEAKLDPVALESETLAVARSTVGNDASHPPTLIVNLGATTTDLSVVSRGSLQFTRSISTGGEALARAISQALGFDLQQSEEYKKTYGLDESRLEGKVMKAIKPVFDVIVEEIKRSINFYNGHHVNNPLKRVVLCGGTASLPGIIVYLAATLDVEVALSNPWRRVNAPAKFSEKELEENGPSFSVAVGLALKEL